MLPVIRVAPVTAELRPALLQLRVTEAQRDFVGDIEPSLTDAECCPGSLPMTILRDDGPVGYYRIELHPGTIAGREFDLPALGLRTFFIDHRWQGQGIATSALNVAVDDVAERFPQARLLVLLVNGRNLAALRLYLRARFVDTGQLYHGGRSGPQHLLWRALP
ncbi:GNAT family N-acetyltransferase [Dyella jejuensis]